MKSAVADEDESQRRRPSPLVRQVVPWLPGLLGLVVVLWKLAPIGDPDTFWHIRAGDLLLEKWSFVISDPFGAAAENLWIFNQWLPQLVLSWAHGIAGLSGVVWVFAVAVLALVAVLWNVTRHRAGGLVAAVTVAVTIFAMAGSLTPRPQIVTFILTAITTDAWLRTAQDRRSRWWLIGLTWVWACSHGMWFLGPLIGGTVLVGLLLGRQMGLATFRRLVVIPLASVVVAALTPVGPRLLTSPFQVSQVTEYIDEWQPAEASYPPFLAALLMVLVVVIHAARDASGRRAHVILLMMLSLAFVVVYGRTIAIAAAILAPLFAIALQSMTGLVREGVSRRERLASLGIWSLTLVLAAVASIPKGEPALGPQDLNAEIAALPSGTVLCNDWTDGGWLIYQHPNVRVTMDTRVELYSVEHIEDYITLLQGKPGWERYIEDNKCSYTLLPNDSGAAEVLRLSNWTEVASGRDADLLRAPDSDTP